MEPVSIRLLAANSARGLLIGLLALVLAGCAATDSMLGAVGLQRVPQPQRVAVPPPVVRVIPAPLAETWTGTYRSVLPCPDCPGLKVSLSLYKDATYELRTESMGGDATIARSGAFTFNADETRITLDANGQNRMFDIVNSTSLRMLDKNGQRITGPESERFILRK